MSPHDYKQESPSGVKQPQEELSAHGAGVSQIAAGLAPP